MSPYCICLPLRDLRASNLFLDVSLLAKDSKEVIKAHRLVLAAASPFFRSALTNPNLVGARNSHSNAGNAHPTLRLPHVTTKELNNILDFIYTGEVQVHKHELDRFMAVARELQIKILTESNMGNMEQPKRKRLMEEEEPTRDTEVTAPEATAGSSTAPTGAGQEKKRKRHRASGYPCEYCGRVMKTGYSLRQHERDQHTAVGVKYKCPLCMGIYKSRNSMEVHIYTKHKELKGIDIACCVLEESNGS